MINFPQKELFMNRSINKEIFIEFPLNNEMETITGKNIQSESMEVIQAICDDAGLKFGGCISSEFSIDIFNTPDRSFDASLKGQWIAVTLKMTATTILYPAVNIYPSETLYPGESPVTYSLLIFAGKIDEVKSDRNNKNLKHIKAYDLMKDLLEDDCTNVLYDGFLHTYGQSYRINALFDKLLEDKGYPYRKGLYFDTEYTAGETIGGRNILNSKWDYLNEKPSVGTILRYICELSGLFCVVKPTGIAEQGDLENPQFKYLGMITFIALGVGEKTDSSSSPAEQVETYERYESLYENDVGLKKYTHLFIRNNYEYSSSAADPQHVSRYALDPEYDVHTEKVGYDLYDNHLIWDNTTGSSNHDLAVYARSTEIADRFSKAVLAFELTALGRPWVEVGDRIEIKVIRTEPNGSFVYDEDDEIVIDTITSYALKKVTKGILAMSDTISVRGD